MEAVASIATLHIDPSSNSLLRILALSLAGAPAPPFVGPSPPASAWTAPARARATLRDCPAPRSSYPGRHAPTAHGRQTRQASYQGDRSHQSTILSGNRLVPQQDAAYFALAALRMPPGSPPEARGPTPGVVRKSPDGHVLTTRARRRPGRECMMSRASRPTSTRSPGTTARHGHGGE